MSLIPVHAHKEQERYDNDFKTALGVKLIHYVRVSVIKI